VLCYLLIFNINSPDAVFRNNVNVVVVVVCIRRHNWSARQRHHCKCKWKMVTVKSKDNSSAKHKAISGHLSDYYGFKLI